jgi:hypothetical protein
MSAALAITVEEIKRRIDADPKTLPSYVFFEIAKAAYERERKETYPFPTKGPAAIGTQEDDCVAAPARSSSPAPVDRPERRLHRVSAAPRPAPTNKRVDGSGTGCVSNT